MPLSLGRLATLKQHFPVLVLEVPVLVLEVPMSVTMTIKDHRLPLLLLL